MSVHVYEDLKNKRKTIKKGKAYSKIQLSKRMMQNSGSVRVGTVFMSTSFFAVGKRSLSGPSGNTSGVYDCLIR